MNDLTLNQRSTPQGDGWWTWEVWLDAPDALLDQVEAVIYTLHASFPNPRQRITDRASRFMLRSGGWGEFMIYAEASMRDGTSVPLRHWLRFQELTPGTGRTVFLTGAKDDESVTDDLQDSLEKRGFTVMRVADAAAMGLVSCAIAVLSAKSNPLLDADLQLAKQAGLPLLVIALEQFPFPECLAAYRCPPSPGKAVSAATTWLSQVLDRPQLALDGSLPSVASPFWSRRLALASLDLDRAAKSVFPLIGSGNIVSTAVAIGPSTLLAVIDGPPQGLVLRLAGSNVPISAVTPAKGFSVLQTTATLPSFPGIAKENPKSPLLVAFDVDKDQKVRLAPGWITKTIQDYDLTHDATAATKGAAIISLASGELLGLNAGPGHAFPAGLIRSMTPSEALVVEASGLESVEADLDESLEKVKAKPEDYQDRNGYDPDFLGVSVPLPKTGVKVELLPYANFTVALAPERRLSLYAVVNINGKTLADIHRAGDPWQLDPRVPAEEQVGGKYYAGTPLDRGHMVRRVDPVWGKNADLAERDTFHYPNSCPQHKNLNRKTWNDLEDYIYANLQRDDQKVTVFTGPVLASDDAVFHDVQLPKEFWKVVVIKKDDGDLSATAYLLSQEDMIEGLEFVYGEFRTYQVSVALIEKKTGLDFGTLRQCDPKTKKTTRGLEAVERIAAEIRVPGDLELDAGTPVAKAAAAGAPATLSSTWQDPGDGERRLYAALDTFDWTVADELTADLIKAVGINPAPYDEPFARRVLSRLQRKRRFNAMIRVGDAFIQQGLASQQLRRRYAQALIDQGSFHAAAFILRNITDDPSVPPSDNEKNEAQGLLGRCGKQMYVNANAPTNPNNAARLQNAIDSYWLSYALNPDEYFWHGINVVACLRRGEVDGIKLQPPADPQKVADDILKNLQARESRSTTGELPAWELATFIEVHVALGQFDEAIRRAKTYADCKDADAFEVASTLRQMQEVWRLRDDQPPGDKILNILRAALLQRQGGSLQLSASTIARTNLEKVFGDDKSVSLKWYQDGLDRAKSIARIEVNGKGFGTGWLVSGELFGRKGLLLMTNAHVIGPDTPDRYPGALRPEDATVNFQMQSWKSRPGKIIFHSPVNELDATILELPELWGLASALPLDPAVLKVNDPPQRLYIIGYPGGRDLEFSLQDNHLLAATERLVHYRTPSEGGSSGSPVFGPTDWKVVALHHAGRKDMPQLSGSGTYEANEGIALGALLRKASGDTQVRLAAG